MKLSNTLILLVLLSVSTALSSARADVIELKNGKKIEGSFIGRDGDSVNVDVDGITMTFKAADVKNIQLGASLSDEKGQVSGKEEAAATNTAGKDASSAPAGEQVVPAGTTLVIRLAESLNPSKHAEGHKFTAKLESAVVIDGNTIVPVDSNVYGVVLEATKSRRLAGTAEIKLGVTDIRVDGVMHKVKTTALKGVGEETAKKTAGQVGKWAAVGALADGSSGARTGAKVGAGAAILSGGNQAQINEGTLLEFNLLEPLKLK